MKGVDSCSIYSPSKIMNHNRDGVILEVSKETIEGDPFDNLLYEEIQEKQRWKTLHDTMA